MDPSIKWYQNKTNVIITVDVNNIVKHDILFEPFKTIIKCSINPNSNSEGTIDYVKELDLHNEIDTEKSRFELKSDLKIYLHKKETKIWDKLTKEKKSNVFIDWTNWNFVDEVPSNIKDNIVNNNIKEALATMNIPKNLTDNELIEKFQLSDSE